MTRGRPKGSKNKVPKVIPGTPAERFSKVMAEKILPDYDLPEDVLHEAFCTARRLEQWDPTTGRRIALRGADDL